MNVNEITNATVYYNFPSSEKFAKEKMICYYDVLFKFSEENHENYEKGLIGYGYFKDMPDDVKEFLKHHFGDENVKSFPDYAVIAWSKIPDTDMEVNEKQVESIIENIKTRFCG